MAMSEAVTQLQLHIEQQLSTLLQRNGSGSDTAPGERLRLEGWMEAALLLAGEEAAALIARWQALLTGNARLHCERVDDVWCVRLDIWQSRAPVKPSTRD